MKIYEIGTGYTPIPAQVPAATESIVEELTKAYLEMGTPVEVLDISTDKRAPHSLPITQVKVPSIFTKSDVSLGIVHKLKRVVYSVALALKLKKILKKADEKIALHFHNQYNMFFFLKLVSARLREKAVLAYTNHNGYWSLPWEQAREILNKRYFQEIESMKKADISFVLNPKMRNNAVEHLGLPKEKVVQINNGVNTDIYRPLSQEKKDELKETLGLTGKKVILQVGSVNENKGQGRSVELLANLLKENADLVYAFAGGIVSAEYFEQVKATAKELGVENQVMYLGMAAPGEEMNSIYNIADATLFVSKYESFGLVCIESLSAGVPVFLCGDGLIDFGKGCILCDIETFENKVSILLNMGERYEELSKISRENAVENYTWQKIASDYERAMKEI